MASRRSSSRGRSSGKGKKGKLPLGKIALGAAAVAGVLYFLEKGASASTTPPNPPNPGPNPLPHPTPQPPTPRRPKNLPAGAGEATVVPNSLGGINTRTGPDPNAPLVSPNDAYNGDTVGILAMGVPPSNGGGAPEEWWQIMDPGGAVGYARAVDPQGVHNFTITVPMADPSKPIPVTQMAGSRRQPGIGSRAASLANAAGYRPFAWR